MNKIKVTMSDLYEQDDNGNTSLHNAIVKKDTKEIMNIIKLISTSGYFDVLDIQNNKGDTALHLVVRKMPLNNIANILIGLGADKDIMNNKGETVEIASSLKEFFAKSNFVMNTEPLEDEWDVKNITIVDAPQSPQIEQQPTPQSAPEPVERTTETPSIDFPSQVSIENLPRPPKPDLIQSDKEKNVENFIGNLLKSKKLD